MKPTLPSNVVTVPLQPYFGLLCLFYLHSAYADGDGQPRALSLDLFCHYVPCPTPNLTSKQRVWTLEKDLGFGPGGVIWGGGVSGVVWVRVWGGAHNVMGGVEVKVQVRGCGDVCH